MSWYGSRSLVTAAGDAAATLLVKENEKTHEKTSRAATKKPRDNLTYNIITSLDEIVTARPVSDAPARRSSFALLD